MIRGTKVPLPQARQVNAELHADIHNRFDVEVIDARTGVVRRKAVAYNTICSQLWTRMMTPEAYFNFIHYGTGAGTPAAADTSLFTFLGAVAPAQTDDVLTHDPANGVFSIRRKIVLSESTAVGAVLSEVGIGYGSAASSLCTHAMLKDMNGNTITINKTATDIINIYATVFVHYPSGGFDGGFARIVPRSVEKGPYDFNNCYIPDYKKYGGFLLYLCGLYNSSYCFAPKALVADHCLPKCNGKTYSMTPTYSAPDKKIVCTATRIGAGESNIGGIEYLHLSLRSDYLLYALSIRVGGALVPRTVITGEAVGTGDGTTKDFSTDFPFWSDGKIYVNGVQQTSGVTISTGIVDALPTYPTVDYLVMLDPVSTVENHIPYIGRQEGTGTVFGTPVIYYNPHYETGIGSFTVIQGSISCSDDLVAWTNCATTVPSELQHKKYWKLTASGSGTYPEWSLIKVPTDYTGKNIHFTAAPASGAVITADYTADCVAKDANHVFDLTVTIQLGEYTE